MSLCFAEIFSGYDFGISKGKVLDVTNTEIYCFGPEYEFEASISMSVNDYLDIPIPSTFLSNQLTKNEMAWFIYWGFKKEIKSPMSTLGNLKEESINSLPEYYPNMEIALFSYKSPIAWYFVLYQLIKWFSLISGILLSVPNLRIKKKRIDNT